MKSKRSTSLVVALLMVTVGPVFAHHGVDSNYDTAHPITLKGTVTAFEFINPHAKLSVDVKDSKGNVERWSAELGSPNSLRRSGWNRSTIKPGDEITVTGSPAKDGSKKLVLQKFVFANGQEGPQSIGNNLE